MEIDGVSPVARSIYEHDNQIVICLALKRFGQFIHVPAHMRMITVIGTRRCQTSVLPVEIFFAECIERIRLGVEQIDHTASGCVITVHHIEAETVDCCKFADFLCCVELYTVAVSIIAVERNVFKSPCTVLTDNCFKL